jgi:hypothetical protein
MINVSLQVRPEVEQTAYLSGLVFAESSATKACLDWSPLDVTLWRMFYIAR